MAEVAAPFRLGHKAEPFVGEVRVAVELENNYDREFERRGLAGEDQVRRETVDIVVDTGAVTLVLPEDLVDRLGLRRVRTVRAVYADGRAEDRWVAGIVTVRVAGREADVTCIVGPAATLPLLGQVPLEEMDLLVDCARRRLVPNPESPDRPLLKVF